MLIVHNLLCQWPYNTTTPTARPMSLSAAYSLDPRRWPNGPITSGAVSWFLMVPLTPRSPAIVTLSPNTCVCRHDLVLVSDNESTDANRSVKGGK